MNHWQRRLDRLEHRRRAPRVGWWDVLAGAADPEALDAPAHDALRQLLAEVPDGDVPDRIEEAIRASLSDPPPASPSATTASAASAR